MNSELVDYISSLLAKDQLEEALGYLMEEDLPTDQKQVVVQLAGQLEALEKSENLGLKGQEDITTERNQIRKGILSLFVEEKKESPRVPPRSKRKSLLWIGGLALGLGGIGGVALWGEDLKELWAETIPQRISVEEDNKTNVEKPIPIDTSQLKEQDSPVEQEPQTKRNTSLSFSVHVYNEPIDSEDMFPRDLQVFGLEEPIHDTVNVIVSKGELLLGASDNPKDLERIRKAGHSLGIHARDSIMIDSKNSQLLMNRIAIYKQRINRNSIDIFPEMPYLKGMYSGEIITGLEGVRSFKGRFFHTPDPNLDIKVTNNSDDVIYIDRIILEVDSSTLDPNPLVILSTKCQQGGSIFLHNESPFPCHVEMNFDFASPSIATYYKFWQNKWDYQTKKFTRKVSLGPKSFKQVNLESELWSFLSQDSASDAYLFGRLAITTLGQNPVKREVKFYEYVSLNSECETSGISPSGRYTGLTLQSIETLYTSGENYIVEQSINQEVRPKRIDRFLVGVGAATSSHHSFKVHLIYGQNDTISSRPINLHILHPASYPVGRANNFLKSLD